MSIIGGAVGAAAAGYAAWRFRSRPNAQPTPPTSQRIEHPDSPECRAAVHEAGHALLALRCSIAGDIRLSVRAEELAAHQAGIVYYRLRHWDAAQIAWCSAVICLGGIAAENAIYGRFRSAGAASDLRQTLTATRSLVKAKALTPQWKETGKRRTLNFRGMFAEPLTDNEVVVLQHAYDTARHLIDRHHTMFGKLTAAILACGTMNENVLARWAGDRSFIRAVGVMQARFL